MLKKRRGRRNGRSVGHVLISTCMWLLLAVLVTTRCGLMPYAFQELIGQIMSSNIGWIILGLVALGVILTCVDIEMLKRRRSWLNVVEVMRSLLLIAAGIDMLFLLVLG